MKYLFIALILLSVFISCKSEQASKNDDISKTDAIEAVSYKDPLVLNTLNLLQGTWNSVTEKNVSVTFENNTRTETKEGLNQSKTRYFEIADRCTSAVTKDKKIISAKAKYISMQDIDMCFFIRKISKNELILSQVGRNNVLKYKKAKSN